MTTQSLNLPIDIPWKRLAVSADMIDTTFGDSKFPPKWRSSIAIFYHEPDDLPESYCDRKITYLKIAYTITGYQLDQKEVEFEFDSEGERFFAVPIVIRAKGSQGGGAWPMMALRLNYNEVANWEVKTPDDVYHTYVAQADIARGHNLVEIAFLNDYVGPEGDRNLFVDSVSVGPKVLTPTDERTAYVVRDSNGNYRYTTPGQREMWSQGELQFPFDYDPQDWMSQYIEEYNNIGAYLPCYGALLHAAVFPNAKRKKEVTRKCIDFSQVPAHNDHPNPLTIGQVTFSTADIPLNIVRDATDFAPQSLNVLKGADMTFPPTSYCEAKVYHSKDVSATLEAYKGEQLVDTKPVSPRPDHVHTVVFEGQDIDRISVKAPQGETFLTEICYDEILYKDLELEDYPYITAFEPQKREMYETVSESGESLSRSLSNINVRKGLTSTESEEVLDIDAGWTFAGATEGPQGGGSLSFGRQGQWGTRNLTTQQQENIRSTDVSRESRETSSHSTTLSQMYHLFNGYHLGTNRAVFFMLPRPHVAEVREKGRHVRTFVNGPRKLEGLQEIFLVVNRPKAVPGICVETLLETAHLDWKVNEQTEQPKPEVSIAQLERFLTGKYRGHEYAYWHSGDEEEYHHQTDSITWDTPDPHEARKVGADPNQKFFVSNGKRKEKSSIRQNGWGVTRQTDFMTYEEALAMYLEDNPDKVPEPVVHVQTNTSMILTARSVKGCLPESKPAKCIEKSVPEAISEDKEWVSLETTVPIPGNLMRASFSNRFVQTIGQKLRASLGSRKRYAKGEIDFLHTEFALGKLKRHLSAMSDEDPNNKPIEELKQIDAKLCKKFCKAFPEVRTRKQALRIPLNRLRRKLKLSDAQARDFQLRLMGVGQPADNDTEAPTPESPQQQVTI